jgi:hypothetical protein
MDNQKEAPENAPTIEAAGDAVEYSTSILEVSDIVVELTYNLTVPATKIIFICDLEMSEDAAAARQAFFAKTEAEQIPLRAQFNVDHLARIVRAVPIGLPGFDEVLNRKQGSNFREQLANAVKAFFAEATPIKRKIAADAVQQYSVRSQPIEFFR